MGAVDRLSGAHDISFDENKNETWFLLARNKYQLEEYEYLARARGVPFKIKDQHVIPQKDINAIQAWERLRRDEPILGQDVGKALMFTRWKDDKLDGVYADRPTKLSEIPWLPDTLSIWTLVKYITFLRSNGQSAQRYEHALWVKITYPIATAVMVFLAIPMVMDQRRTASASQGILVGGLVGLGFHLLNQAAGHLGIVYEFAPVISAAGPALLMFLVASVLLLRTT